MIENYIHTAQLSHHPSIDVQPFIFKLVSYWDMQERIHHYPYNPKNDRFYREAIIYEILCQNCKQQFTVLTRSTDPNTISKFVHTRGLHYGDPPATGCCLAGYTMNSIPFKAFKYWHRLSDSSTWISLSEFNYRPLVPHWAQDIL